MEFVIDQYLMSKNSPKLKPRNRSKLEEIRSIFEPYDQETSLYRPKGDTTAKNEVKGLNLDTRDKVIENGTLCGDNFKNIIHAKSAKNLVKKSDLKSPSKIKKSDLKAQTFPRVDNSNRVVRVPNPTNSQSPKSDIKKKKLSKRSENGFVKRDEVDLKSQPTISRFFGNKNMTKHDDSIGKSNEIHDKY